MAANGYSFSGAGAFAHSRAESTTQEPNENGLKVTVIFPATVNLTALTDTGQIVSYLEASQSPVVPLKLELELSSANWQAILTALATAGKNIVLDLAACTASASAANGGLATNGTFNIYSSYTAASDAGKNMIQSLILPNAAVLIQSGRFVSLKTINGYTIETIGGSAFSGCTALTSVSLPATQTIERRAFYGCTALTSANLPAAETIGDSAFSGCTALTSVSLPAAETIGSGAFSGCTALTGVSLPAAASIPEGAFSYSNKVIFTLTGTGQLSTGDNGKMLIQNGALLLAYSLPPADITLPNNITSIGAGVFASHSSSPNSVTNLNAPEVLSIGASAFYDCTSLTTVNLPKVETLPDGDYDSGVFSGCTSLATVNLPAVTYIGDYAFSYTGTTALTVTLGAEQPMLGIFIFEVFSPKNVTVKVPSTSLATYSNGYNNSNTTAPNWGNAFRGWGWDGDDYGSQSGYVNTYISLTFVGY